MQEADHRPFKGKAGQHNVVASTAGSEVLHLFIGWKPHRLKKIQRRASRPSLTSLSEATDTQTVPDRLYALRRFYILHATLYRHGGAQIASSING